MPFALSQQCPRSDHQTWLRRCGGSCFSKVCIFRQSLPELESPWLCWCGARQSCVQCHSPPLWAKFDRCLCFPGLGIRCQLTDRISGPPCCLCGASSSGFLVIIEQVFDAYFIVSNASFRHQFLHVSDKATCLCTFSKGANVNGLVGKWARGAVTVSTVSAPVLVNSPLITETRI